MQNRYWGQCGVIKRGWKKTSKKQQEKVHPSTDGYTLSSNNNVLTCIAANKRGIHSRMVAAVLPEQHWAAHYKAGRLGSYLPPYICQIITASLYNDMMNKNYDIISRPVHILRRPVKTETLRDAGVSQMNGCNSPLCSWMQFHVVK